MVRQGRTRASNRNRGFPFARLTATIRLGESKALPRSVRLFISKLSRAETPCSASTSCAASAAARKYLCNSKSCQIKPTVEVDSTKTNEPAKLTAFRDFGGFFVPLSFSYLSTSSSS
jgi:hypothetical protein